METISIKITARTKCGGKLVVPDDIVEATRIDALTLIGTGMAVPVDENEGRSTIDLILDVIGDLDTDNPDHFTADEKPRVEILEELTGRNISTDERDEAWDLISQ